MFEKLFPRAARFSLDIEQLPRRDSYTGTFVGPDRWNEVTFQFPEFTLTQSAIDGLLKIPASAQPGERIMPLLIRHALQGVISRPLSLIDLRDEQAILEGGAVLANAGLAENPHSLLAHLAKRYAYLVTLDLADSLVAGTPERGTRAVLSEKLDSIRVATSTGHPKDFSFTLSGRTAAQCIQRSKFFRLPRLNRSAITEVLCQIRGTLHSLRDRAQETFRPYFEAYARGYNMWLFGKES